MNRRKQFLFAFIILSLTFVASADLTTLYENLNKDLNKALQYFNYMETANYSKEILEAKEDLDMAIELAERIETEGEVLLRQSRIKLEEFWVNVSYSLPANTKMAYIEAEELTRKALAKDLQDYTETLKRLGFNGIVADTARRDGYTIFPTRDQEQYRILQGTDPLRELAMYAKENELDLFLVMDVGFIAEELIPGLVRKYPDWVAVSENGDIVDDRNYIYLNVSHPDVRKYYINRARDLAEYNIQALILRVDLPIKNDKVNDFSYDVYSRDQFKQQYGYDPLDVKNTSRTEWNEWRSEQINSLISQISRNIAEDYSHVKLGAIVILDDFPIADLKYEKLVDWESWVEREYINYLLPQITTSEQYDEVLRDLSVVSGKFLAYPVFFYEEERNLSEFLACVNELQLRGGFVFGHFAQMDQFTSDAFVKTIGNTETISLHQDPWRALALNMTEIESQAPQAWFTDIREFNNKLSKLVMAPTGANYIEALAQVRAHLEYLRVKAITTASAFSKRMEYETNIAKRLLDLGVLDRTPQGKKLY